MLSSFNFGELGQVTTTVGSTLAPVWSFVSGFLILLVLMLIFMLYSRYVGRGPFVSVVSALYIAYALYAAFPYGEYLPSGPPLTALGARVVLYIGFFLIAYIILRRVAASDFIHIGTFGLLLLSFVTAAFVMVMAYDVLPVRSVYAFSHSLDNLFAAKQYFFWWFIAPLIGLFLFAR